MGNFKNEIRAMSNFGLVIGNIQEKYADSINRIKQETTKLTTEFWQGEACNAHITKMNAFSEKLNKLHEALGKLSEITYNALPPQLTTSATQAETFASILDYGKGWQLDVVFLKSDTPNIVQNICLALKDSYIMQKNKLSAISSIANSTRYAGINTSVCDEYISEINRNIDKLDKLVALMSDYSSSVASFESSATSLLGKISMPEGWTTQRLSQAFVQGIELSYKEFALMSDKARKIYLENVMQSAILALPATISNDGSTLRIPLGPGLELYYNIDAEYSGSEDNAKLNFAYQDGMLVLQNIGYYNDIAGVSASYQKEFSYTINLQNSGNVVSASFTSGIDYGKKSIFTEYTVSSSLEGCAVNTVVGVSQSKNNEPPKLDLLKAYEPVYAPSIDYAPSVDIPTLPEGDYTPVTIDPNVQVVLNVILGVLISIPLLYISLITGTAAISNIQTSATLPQISIPISTEHNL